jgi:hypothetical protein
VIQAGRSANNTYLQIAIHYDTESVWTEILESRNLHQSATRIHKSAISWIRRLEDRIRRELGREGFSRALAP